MSKLKIRPKAKEDVEVAEIDLADSLDRFNSLFADLSNVLVERDDALEAVQLAILSSQNILLLGLPGVAKSMLAEQVFKRIKGARFFKVQMMKETTRDELFGPMDSKAYREQAIWKHNIHSMLPDCHFGFIDEVYRGTGGVLGSTFNVLNERTFINGRETIKCPLITAIGTTNFVLDTDELAAFHDRWLIKVNTKPIDSSANRRKMLNQYLTPPEIEDSELGLDDIKGLQQAVNAIELSEEIVELYEQLCIKLAAAKIQQKITISDRRLCQSLRLAQAKYLIDDGAEGKPFAEEHLQAVAYGLITIGNNEQKEEFQKVFGETVGDYLKTSDFTRRMKNLNNKVKKMEGEYDVDDDLNEAQEKLIQSEAFLRALREIPTGETPKQGTEASRLLNDNVKRLESLVGTYSEHVNQLAKGRSKKKI